MNNTKKKNLIYHANFLRLVNDLWFIIVRIDLFPLLIYPRFQIERRITLDNVHITSDVDESKTIKNENPLLLIASLVVFDSME